MLEKAKFIDVVAIAPDAASGMKSLVVNVPAFIKLFAGKNIAEQSDMEAMIKDF